MSLSEMTWRGIPNFKITCLKNNLAVSSSVTLVVVGMKIAYLVSLSTITRILSNPSERGNSGMKSMLTTSKGCDGIGIGCSNPVGPCLLGLVF